MRRWRILLLVAATLFVVAAAVFLWQLPEIVRRVAVARIPELTGRAVSIDDIDLNLFTGRVALKGFRMAEREGSDAFIKFDRLDARLFLPSIVLLDIRLSSVSLTGLEARLIRTAPDTFNFSDIIDRLPKPDPNAKPGRLSVTLDHVALARSKVTIVDHAVTPAADWSLQSLDAEASSFSTDTRHAPAEASVRLKSGEASVEFQKIRFKLQPFATSASIKLAGFDATRLKPYIVDPEVTLGAAVVSAALDVSVKRDGPKLQEAWAAGDITVQGIALSHIEGPGRFLALKRFHARIDKADAVARAVTLAQVEVESPNLGMVRRPDGQMDILIALDRLIQRRAAEERARLEGAKRPGQPAPEGAPAAPPAPPETPWLVRITELLLTNGKVTVTDETVTPPAQWHVDDLAVKVAKYSIAGTDPPATGEVTAHVTGPGRGNNVATLDLAVSSLRTAAPFAGIAQVKLTDFDLRAIRPYVAQQIGIAAVRTRGKLSVDLQADLARQEGAAELARGLVSGTVRLQNVAVVPRGERTPLLRLPKLVLGIKQADLVGRSVALGALEIEGLEGRITREASGEVDIVTIAERVKGEAIAGPKAGAKAGTVAAPETKPNAAPAAPRGPPPPPWRLSLDRLTAKNGIGIFEDERVSPVTTLTVNDIMVTAQKLLWPTVRGAAPGTLEITAGLPGGGLFLLQGTASLEPLDITFQVSSLDVSIEPYQAYFPFPARFKGLFSGDSLNTIKIENGKFLAASQGNAFAKQIEVWEPGAESPAMTLEKMEIRGIDFSWPNYAFINLVYLLRPEVRIERATDGTLNLRRMFTVPKKGPDTEPDKGKDDRRDDKKKEDKDQSPEAVVAGATAEPKEPNLLEEMVLDFDRITIEEGYNRFLDQTTKPPFSQDIGRLAVTIRNLSNAPGRRSTLTLQGVVGGDAALDLRGEMSRLGDDFSADLVGELRDFTVASANPYANSFLAWIVKQGKLGVKVHYRIEQDRLMGENQIVVKNLQVAKGAESDEVQKRLGLPLGLIVALMKDSHGDINFDVPISGSVTDKSVDWGETIWAAVKQVLVKVLASPFRSIGRMFTGSDDKVEEVKVDPVVFAAGSSVIGPAMEGHLNRVAQFLRDTPAVSLSLSPVATAKDFDRLRGQEVTARIQKMQRERGIADYPTAVGIYYLAQNIPGEVPKSADEQLKVLQEHEQLPEERIKELLDRRVAATKDRLVKTENVVSDRLLPGEPHVAPADTGDGRIDFAITAE
ncbi:MAG TPA: DUF748 domain-containing protein [Methylomirabilota bacterium]|nr:DUF748 domain-containing protein [Methylomirabilota bacterium]